MDDFKFTNNSNMYPALIARQDIQNYFPWLSPKNMANLDSSGMGPPGRFKCGRAIVYQTKSLLEWLDERTEMCSEPLSKS